MPCEKYREALSEAAVPGDTYGLSTPLRAHLHACSACRGFFAEEQRLFAAIDAGVAGKMNTDVPLHLVQRVRALLAEDRPARRAFWTMFATVGVAAVMLIVFVLRVHQRSTHSPLGAGVAASYRTPATLTPANTTSNEAERIAVSDATHATFASKRRDRANSQRLRTSVSWQPSPAALEVIVPPEEREALARYVAAEKRSQLPAAMITLAASSEPSRWPLLFLEIPDLEMKPLPDLGGDTPDSTEEN